MLFEKQKFELRNTSPAFIHYAYVDFLRQKIGRAKSGEKSPRRDFMTAFFSAAEIQDHNTPAYEDRKVEHFVTLIKIIKEHGSRQIICDTYASRKYRERTGMELKKKISLRRALLMYAKGWTLTDIGKEIGVSGSKISQLMTKEINRISEIMKSI
jgi:hypothetical protein